MKITVSTKTPEEDRTYTGVTKILASDGFIELIMPDRNVRLSQGVISWLVVLDTNLPQVGAPTVDENKLTS